ncbi:MAG: WD40/YVTN/BNR-like repeat-containing protein, partial [Thermoanaerobaculia bacterium]
MKRTLTITAQLLLVITPFVGVADAQTRKGGTAARESKPEASSATADSQKKFKAIWEPVNYAEDVEFTDVHFVTEDVGWATGLARSAAGEGGFILHTKDGGKTWTVQLGDPHSATRGFVNLRFIDQTHGWAGQFGEKLVRTSDGETWEEMGRFPQLHPYAFTSANNGVYIDGERIFRTQDGGKSWKEVFRCRTKVEVKGLTREVGCHLEGIHFPSATLGYAVSRAMPNGASALVKTEDGGATWSVFSVVPDASAGEDGLFFVDEKRGFVRT